MKSLLILLAFFCLVGAAQAQKLNPYCYTGSITMKSGETQKVFLQLNSIRGKYYLVEKFNIGDYSMSTSGYLASENTLQFNSNDDYIPGGNASYNVDVELKFNGKDVSGAYKYYTYGRNGGYGGFGQGAKANLTPVAEGEIELQLCKTEVIIQ